MARGSEAKNVVIKKIAEAFGDNFIGEFDKKIYVWAQENGEQVQIAISLTCPKNQITVDRSANLDGGDLDFSDSSNSTAVAVTSAAPAEITEEEKKNIADLMAKLGL